MEEKEEIIQTELNSQEELEDKANEQYTAADI